MLAERMTIQVDESLFPTSSFRLPFILAFQCGSQGFNGERGCVLLARGQSPNRLNNRLTSNLRSLFHLHSFDHLCQHRAADKRGRAAVGEKARGLNAPVAHAQRQTQAITADRIGFFRDGVCVRERAGIARVGKMIFENFRVGQDWISTIRLC